MNSEPWSRAGWNRSESTRIEDRTPIDSDNPLELDLSSSSSSMPVASPCGNGAELQQREPDLEELDAGFDALLEQSDR